MTQVSSAGPRPSPGLQARDVTFGFGTDDPLIDKWSFLFERGAMTALTGPSGRGKSTLLYLLGLMLQPRGGEILVDGQPTRLMRDGERASLRAHQFGFVFQDAALDASRTVIDNVVETALYRGQSRIQSLNSARVLLEKFGVDLPSGRKPGQVSGGQAQRIALCRALLSDPPILLADEPTGNLDSQTTALVVAAMRDHAHNGGTVIIVTHSSSVADACDLEVSL